jgi:uncharacterized membrane protein YhhN
VTLLSLVILASAALHIRAEYRGPRRHVYIFKPLTTSLIILLALLSAPETPLPYKWFVVLGLIFSLGGDVFLMLPQDRFVLGLLSFLIAHLWYIAAFSLGVEQLLTSWGIIPLLIYGLVMGVLLLPGVKPKLRLPVTLYLLIILIMAWRAVERWAQLGDANSAFALAGALFFVVSDSVLALDRFRRPFRSARAIVLSSYFLAQWLIALSI